MNYKILFFISIAVIVALVILKMTSKSSAITSRLKITNIDCANQSVDYSVLFDGQVMGMGTIKNGESLPITASCS